MAVARSLPSGDVCFLFTDVEGSTAILRAIGDAAWSELQRRMLDIISTAAEAHDGVLVSTEGDGCFLAFADADGARAACTNAQRKLRSEEWGDRPLRVRMGLHAGTDVTPHGQDYVALAVSQAARVCSAASGGQVFATSAVVDRLADAAGLLDLGLYTIRDFDAPVRLYELSDGPKVAPRVPAAFDVRLPHYRTATVGRDAEIADVRAALNTSRLVTLAGASGIGKTRLAVAVLAGLATELAVGPWFVDLGTAREPRDVGDVVALAVGCPPDVELDLYLDALLDDRPGVMVLDDCDRLPEAAAAAAELLLSWCPTLRIVATSSEALHLSGERVFVVDPMNLPRDDGPASVLDSDSGRLYLERAERVGPEVELTTSSAQAVARICTALGGVPLAIELIAALGATAMPEQLAAALRSASLDTVIDWALEPLSELELRALASLTVAEMPIPLRLAGAALEAVDLTGDDQIGVLDALVARSLLDRDADGAYRLLNPIRSRAREHLSSQNVHAVRQTLLAECLAATVAPPVPLSAHEPIVPTARALIADSSLSVSDRQQLATQLAPWWIGRLNPTRAREHLEAVLALGNVGPATAALHLAIADTYVGGRDSLDAERHISDAARLIGEHDAVDPALVERLKSVAARAADRGERNET